VAHRLVRAAPVLRPSADVANRSLEPVKIVVAPLQRLFEELDPAGHKARAIWDLVGRMDLSRLPSRCAPPPVARAAGLGPAVDAQLVIYAYSEGISSAREIERLMEWEPGMQWLGGRQAVNHHSLSDSRIEHRAALDELFAQLLALLARAGLVDLKQVMHDGTKIRAVAGADTFRRRRPYGSA